MSLVENLVIANSFGKRARALTNDVNKLCSFKIEAFLNKILLSWVLRGFNKLMVLILEYDVLESGTCLDMNILGL